MNPLVTLILVLHLMLPISALAEGALKHPLSYSLQEYALVLALALAGGLASWWAKVRRGELVMWNLSALIGELCMSAFAGVLAFWLCELFKLDPLLTACIVGMTGHAGARALTWFEVLGQRYVETRLGLKDKEDKS